MLMSYDRTEGAILSESFSLSDIFNDICMEWLALRQQWQSSANEPETLVLDAAEKSTHLARKLVRTVTGKIGENNIWQAEAAQFAFVALIDETLIYQSWPGQTHWQETPLERRLFGSCIAGEHLPTQIETLLKERNPLSRDLAEIYLMCLVLGFRGRLRDNDEEGHYEEWCRRLFAFTCRRDPEYKYVTEMLEQDSVIEPARLPERHLFPDGFRLLFVIGIVFLLLLGLSQWLWSDIRNRLEPGLQNLTVISLSTTLVSSESAKERSFPCPPHAGEAT